MNLFGFGSSVQIDIKLDGVEKRKHVPVKDAQGQMQKIPLYQEDDDISGTVSLLMNNNRRVEHQGLRIELIGLIEVLYEKSQSSEFMSMGRELEPAGVLETDKQFKFIFSKFEKENESYSGIQVKLRYFLRVTFNKKQIKELPFQVYKFNVCDVPLDQESLTPLKMEVGIEECLHIEFEYNKPVYHLKDCVIGKVSFVLVRIKIKYMELAIIRRETCGSGPQSKTENETLVKYEVMDGCPIRGEIIPIRLYLSGYDVTPSQKKVQIILIEDTF